MVQKIHSKKEVKTIQKEKIKHEKLRLLEQKIKEKVREAEENEELAKRIKAEFDNYKKRMLKDYDERINTANETLIKRLLSVIDAFERALDIKKIEDEGFKSFYNGMKLIYKDFNDIFEEFGVTIICPEKGELFDPEIHEAVMVQEVDGQTEDIVLEVLEKGYKLSNRLLRAAKVKVGKGMKDQDSPGKEEGFE